MINGGKGRYGGGRRRCLEDTGRSVRGVCAIVAQVGGRAGHGGAGGGICRGWWLCGVVEWGFASAVWLLSLLLECHFRRRLPAAAIIVVTASSSAATAATTGRSLYANSREIRVCDGIASYCKCGCRELHMPVAGVGCVRAAFTLRA